MLGCIAEIFSKEYISLRLDPLEMKLHKNATLHNIIKTLFGVSSSYYIPSTQNDLAFGSAKFSAQVRHLSVIYVWFATMQSFF